MELKGRRLLKTVLSKPLPVLTLAFLLFLPLLFLGTHSSHDWGDDFAQYIHQAGNIVMGIQQSETGFVFSEQNYIGPQAYPVGFPLMLAPVYAFAGNDMFAFTAFISLIYIILGLLMVVFYQRFFSWATALMLALIFLYNPQTIIFKREVMSDIPFAALLVLNFILYGKLETGKIKQLLILAAVTGCMLIVRPAGIVFLVAVAMEQLVETIRKKMAFNNFLIFTVIFIGLPIALYFLVNSVVFRIPSGGSIRDYLNFYYSGNIFGLVPENFTHHLQVIRYLYEPESGIFKGVSVLSGSIVLTLALIGFVQRITSRVSAIEWFFVLYLMMLLVFPNNDSAFRMMVPVGFVLLFYAACGFRLVNLFPNVKMAKKAIFAGLLMLLMFVPAIVNIVRTGDHLLEGPQKASAIETFDFIRKNVPPDAMVVFAKPRALALYSGVQSIGDPFATDPTLIHNQIVKSDAQYILIHHQLSGKAMKRYVRIMQNRLTKLWENKQFVFYRIIPINPAAPR